MNFYKGVDISSLLELEDKGVKFYAENGEECEALELCKRNGVNSIRLRIWNEPQCVPEAAGYCDLEHTMQFAKRIKEKGMHFMLDFHYSDWWADPGKQTKPYAWKNLTGHALEQAVYEYTKQVLESLRAQNTMPDMVQIGNEIRSGMLFPDGEVPNFTQLANLVNAGIRATREVSTDIQVMIHLDQGGKYYYLKEWFDAMFEAGMNDIDVIGISFYPFWHGTFTDLKHSMEGLIERYKLPVIVVETAHPWRRSEDGFVTEDQEKIAGFPAGIEEQRHVMQLLMNIVASVENGMGQGVYYWEPLSVPLDGQGSWANNMGVLDEKGKVLPGLAEFRFTREQLCKEKIAKIYHVEPILIEQGKELVLPEQIEVLRYDGERYSYPVEWEQHSIASCGEYVLQGNMTQINEKTQIQIVVVDKLPERENLVKNADFKAGQANWMLVDKLKNVTVEINQEEAYLQVNSNQNFEFAIMQDVRIAQAGKYQLSVSYRGTNTTDVKVRLYGEQVSGEKLVKVEKVIYPTDEQWMDYDICDIELQEGVCSIGIEMKTPPVIGKIKGFKLCRIIEK